MQQVINLIYDNNQEINIRLNNLQYFLEKYENNRNSYYFIEEKIKYMYHSDTIVDKMYVINYCKKYNIKEFNEYIDIWLINQLKEYNITKLSYNDWKYKLKVNMINNYSNNEFINLELKTLSDYDKDMYYIITFIINISNKCNDKEYYINVLNNFFILK